MTRAKLLVTCLAVGLAAMAAPVYGETYYVEEDNSSVNSSVEVSFSASGFLKLVLFDPNGIFDFLNPKADAMAGIYANTSVPGSISGTLDADVAADTLTLNGMDLDLLTAGPQAFQAGADVHVDAIPFIADLIEPFIDQINPNWVDPNAINDIIATLTGGFDFDYDFEMTINSLTMTYEGDPITGDFATATITSGEFTDLSPWASIQSQIQFNGGNPLDLPAVPLPFSLDGTYSPTPTDTLTMASNAADGGVETPEIIIIDRLIELPIGDGGIDVTFQIQLKIDAGTAGYSIAPSLEAVTGYLLTTSADPAQGSITADPAGPEYAPGTEVELTATAAEGWNFAQWDGDLSGSANPATITMDTHKSVSAVFVEDQVSLTVNTDGNGSVLKTPSGGLYFPGTDVTLTPIADLGWEFTGWTGDVPAGQENDNPLTITITDDTVITAVFEESGNCGAGATLPLAVGLMVFGAVVIRRR